MIIFRQTLRCFFFFCQVFATNMFKESKSWSGDPQWILRTQAAAWTTSYRRNWTSSRQMPGLRKKTPDVWGFSLNLACIGKYIKYILHTYVYTYMHIHSILVLSDSEWYLCFFPQDICKIIIKARPLDQESRGVYHSAGQRDTWLKRGWEILGKPWENMGTS